MMYRLLSAVTLLALVLSGVLINTSVIGAERPIDKYIEYMERLIERLEQYIEAHNISLPEDLQANLEEAKSLVSQAREADEEEAVDMLIKAGTLLAPVIKYVYTVAPPEETLDVEAVMAAISVRLRIVESAIEAAERMKESGVVCGAASTGYCIDINIDEIIADLREARDELLQLMDEVDEIGPEAAMERLREIDQRLEELIMSIRQSLRRDWASISLQMVAGTITMAFVMKVMAEINSSINLINDGQINEARARLALLSSLIGEFIERAERIAEKGVEIGVDEKVRRKAIDVVEVMRDVKSLVDSAIESLDNGDVEAALATLEQALNRLEGLMEELPGLGIPVPMPVLERLEEMKEFIREEIRRIRGGMDRLANQFLSMLRQFEERIDELVRKYEAGEITREYLIVQLGMIREGLLELRDRLSRYPNIPDFVIKYLDSLIQRVDELLAKYS